MARAARTHTGPTSRQTRDHGAVSWRREIVVDTALAARLIGRQFPHLGRVEPLGEGWDYSALRVDTEVVSMLEGAALAGVARSLAG